MTPPDELEAVSMKPFSDAFSRFESLLAQGRRVFLIGAGCSKCANLPLTVELTACALRSNRLDATSNAILQAVEAGFEGAGNAHIEDYLSELVDLLALAERRESRGAKNSTVAVSGTDYPAHSLRVAVEQVKLAIAEAIDLSPAIATHRAFVQAVHRTLRDGKSLSSPVVDYIVLNYDSLIEDALALERFPYADGMDGGVTGWWNPSVFRRTDLVARVLKLHGSINWQELPGDSLPRRVPRSLQGGKPDEQRVLIWPASTKYRETQLDPFAQLLQEARGALSPTDRSQRVLVVCGYSFGDGHVNAEIERALLASNGNLTVVVFTSDEEPRGTLATWHSSPLLRGQLLVFAKRGFFHADDVFTSDVDLPWWKFEILVRLLKGER